MKKLLLVIIALSAVQASARFRPYEGSFSVVASTEDLAIAKAQEALPSIRNMSNKEVIRDGRFHNCTFRTNRINPSYKFVISGVKLTKLYKITDNQIIEPYYMASINYIFRQCKDSKN